MEFDKNNLEDNAGLEENSRENLHVLLNSIKDINKPRELKSLLEESMEAIRLVMSSEASSLMLLDEDTGELNISLPTGPVKKEIEGIRIPKNKGIGGWVIEKKQPFISNDPENSDKFWGEVAKEFKTRNIICVPLINRNNKAIGVLQALNKRKGEEFNPHDIPVFQALASHITTAIERVREQEALFEQIRGHQKLQDAIGSLMGESLDMLISLMEQDKSKEDTLTSVFDRSAERLRSVRAMQKLFNREAMADSVSLTVYLQRLSEKICDVFSGAAQVSVSVSGDSVQSEKERALAGAVVLGRFLVQLFKFSITEKVGGELAVEVFGNESERIHIKTEDVKGTTIYQMQQNADGLVLPELTFMETFGIQAEKSRDHSVFHYSV